jgi:hypothetical protein
VDRLFKASFARRASMVEFMPDTQEASRGLVVGAAGWREKLEDNGGDYNRAEMVKASLLSDEYRKRFGAQ